MTGSGTIQCHTVNLANSTHNTQIHTKSCISMIFCKSCIQKWLAAEPTALVADGIEAKNGVIGHKYAIGIERLSIVDLCRLSEHRVAA